MKLSRLQAKLISFSSVFLEHNLQPNTNQSHSITMGNSFSYTPYENDTVAVESQSPTTLKPVRNSYATWSVALKALYDAAIADDVVFTENQHAVVAYQLIKNSGTPIESALENSISPVSVGELIAHIRDTMGDELTLKDFKGFDLGGRDCGTITKVMAGKLPADKMPKFSGKFALMTGGTLHSRAVRLHNIRNGPVVVAESVSLTAPARPVALVGTDNWFLLDPNAETLFTGLSVLGYLENEVEDYKNTLIIPVGSTDAHFFYIDTRGRIRFKNILDYSGEDTDRFGTVLSELVGENEAISRVVFAGSFLFGLEVRKFMADNSIAQAGVEDTDIDYDKMTFTSISPTTGDLVLGKILASRGSIADRPDDYDFTYITRGSGKGPELAKFLECVFHNDFMRNQIERNIHEVLSFARTSLPHLCDEDVQSMLNGFADEVKGTRRQRTVML